MVAGGPSYRSSALYEHDHDPVLEIRQGRHGNIDHPIDSTFARQDQRDIH